MLRFKVLKNYKGENSKKEELMVEKNELINLKALAKIEGYVTKWDRKKFFFFSNRSQEKSINIDY